MRVYVLRHGIAEPRRPRKADAARKLTGEGRQKLARVLECARQARAAPTLILSSPLVRAMQTAEAAAEALGYKGEIAQTKALLPESDPPQLWEDLRARSDEKQVMVVGHEPHLSASVAYLLGAPPLRLDLKKGGMVRLDIERLTGDPEGVLKWVLAPALA